MHTDTTPLHVIGAYTAIAERHEVQFKDDSAIGLYQVLHHGHPDMFLRCFIHDQLHAVVIDLRGLARSLAAEMLVQHERDHNGLILYTLRARYANKAEFAAAAIGNALAVKLLKAEASVHQPQLWAEEEALQLRTAPLQLERPVHIDGRAYA